MFLPVKNVLSVVFPPLKNEPIVYVTLHYGKVCQHRMICHLFAFIHKQTLQYPVSMWKILFHKLDFQSAVEKWRYSHLNIHQTIKWQNISSFLLMPIKYTALCNIAVHINHQPFFVMVDWNQRKNKFILNHLHLFTRNMNRYILGIIRNMNRYILGVKRNINRYIYW